MLVATSALGSFSRLVTLVDGSFDPIHDGHVAYFREARSLGLPILCNIAPDVWTKSKHPILLPREKRAIVLDALRDISYVHCGSISTSEVLSLLKPANYAKGSDWLRRGGIPMIEQQICDQFEICVHYLDTVVNSSSQLLTELIENL